MSITITPAPYDEPLCTRKKEQHPRCVNNGLVDLRKQTVRNKLTEQNFAIMIVRELTPLRQVEKVLLNYIESIEFRLDRIEQHPENTQGDGVEHSAPLSVDKAQSAPSVPDPLVLIKTESQLGFIQCFLCANAHRKN